MNRGPEFDMPPYLDDLFGKPLHDWLRVGGYSNREKQEIENLRLRQLEAQGAAFASPKSLGFLYFLGEQTSVEPEKLEELATSFSDWDAIYNVVRAGWAQSHSGGIVITQPGKDVIERIFEPQENPSPTPKQ